MHNCGIVTVTNDCWNHKLALRLLQPSAEMTSTGTPAQPVPAKHQAGTVLVLLTVAKDRCFKIYDGALLIFVLKHFSLPECL